MASSYDAWRSMHAVAAGSALESGLAAVVAPEAAAPAEAFTLAAAGAQVTHLLALNSDDWLLHAQDRHGGALVEQDAFVLRTAPGDAAQSQALWRLVSQLAWDMVSVVYEDTLWGEAAAEAIAAAAEDSLEEAIDSGDESAALLESVPFNAGRVQEALDVLERAEPRAVVLLARPTEAARILEAAGARGLAGQVGWAWVGYGWVTPQTPAAAAASAAQAGGNPRAAYDAVWAAMAGAVGVGPARGDALPATVQPPLDISALPDAHVLAVTAAQLNSTALLRASDCAALSGDDAALKQALPDSAAPLWDAVWATGQSIAAYISCNPLGDVGSGPGGSTPNACAGSSPGLGRMPQALAELLRGNQVPIPSLRTGSLAFDADGDRVGTPMSLYNVPGNGYGEQPASHINQAGSWNGASWDFSGTLVWPGGRTDVPTDRSVVSSATAAAVFAVLAGGVALVMVAGARASRSARLEELMPESLLAILLGAVLGGILSAFPRHSAGPARFDENVFSLVLLPPIIFHSGLALDKHPFFAQLGTILLFSVLGTAISTVIVGGVVLGFSDLSPPEAMAYGALISAVDPVAVLSALGRLQVPPKIYSLLYGEAVINDAAAVVMFRTAAHFMTTEYHAWDWLTAALLVCAVGLLSALGGTLLALLGSRLLRVPGVRTGPSVLAHRAASRAAAQAGASTAAASALPAPATAEAVASPARSDGGASSTAREHVTPLAPAQLLEEADSGHGSGTLEAAVWLAVCVVSYAGAEALGGSGIVATLFAGIGANHWGMKACSPAGARATTVSFRLLASVFEAAVFFLVGVNAVLFAGTFKAGIAIAGLLACYVARAVHVAGLSVLVNGIFKLRHGSAHERLADAGPEEPGDATAAAAGKPLPLPASTQILLWHSGLRGAIAYATGVAFPSQHREEIVAATSVVIIATIVLGAPTISPLLRKLGIPTGVPPTSHAQRVADTHTAASNAILKRWLARVDRHVIRKFIYGREATTATAVFSPGFSSPAQGIEMGDVQLHA